MLEAWLQWIQEGHWSYWSQILNCFGLQVLLHFFSSNLEQFKSKQSEGKINNEIFHPFKYKIFQTCKFSSAFHIQNDLFRFESNFQTAHQPALAAFETFFSDEVTFIDFILTGEFQSRQIIRSMTWNDILYLKVEIGWSPEYWPFLSLHLLGLFSWTKGS